MASQRLRKARKEKGLCVPCGKKPDAGFETCEPCRKRIAGYHAAAKNKQLAAAASGVRGRPGDRQPRMVLGTMEITDLPVNARVLARAWLYLARRMFKALLSPNRVIARAVLQLMSECEHEARRAESK